MMRIFPTATVALFVSLLVSVPAVGAAPLVNQLKHHPSPYLALHGEDPVAWQDWSRDVLARAKRENKLIYLSVGYFSCHWCHVMQRESYRDPAIAALLNARFIPVKIDRELEPALDARMIDFAQATRGRAGWPLNVFVTPQGAPLYATLYLPKDDFRAVIERIDGMWRDDGARLAAMAQEALPRPQGPGKPRLDPKQVHAHGQALRAQLLARADMLQGGFGEQNKFPTAPQLMYLLHDLARRSDPAAASKVREFLQLTLDQMASQGLHDHLGGGFFRYTVDPAWRTPHFEKMLYDNALLAQLYLRASVVLGRPDYRATALRTLDFILSDMAGKESAFIAAISAVDAKGVEGGYYLWDEATLNRVLDAQEVSIYRRAFGMTDAAPFAEGYLPIQVQLPDDVARALAMQPQAVAALLTSAQDKLRAARAQRSLPRDTKQLAAWNGLALSALAQAAQLTGQARYRAAGARLREYLATVLWDSRSLRRAVADGESLGRAGLEDYAYVAAGLFDWAQVSRDAKDLQLAKQIMQEGWRRFYFVDQKHKRDKAGWRLSEGTLMADEGREDVVADGPMPSPAAVLVRVTLAIASQTKDARLRDRTLRAVNTGHAQLQDDPFWYATHIGVMEGALALP